MIFMTGSTGFVGKPLSAKLKESGLELKVLSRYLHNEYDTVVCDLQSDMIPDDVMKGVETVYHLAAFSHDMRDANKIKDQYQKVNVDATVKLAQLAVISNVKRFVFVSSVKAGGRSPLGLCAGERDQNDPEGVYGETKREAELALLKIGKESGMCINIIRPSLVYGPNVKGNLQAMFSGIKRGWFPPLPETNNKRSMIHVDDLVRAILLISSKDCVNGEIFIATDGEHYSSRGIYNTMCHVLGKKVPRWSVPKFLFQTVSLINLGIKYKINKLLGDDCYSSAKLEALGFTAQKTLKDLNETSL